MTKESGIRWWIVTMLMVLGLCSGVLAGCGAAGFTARSTPAATLTATTIPTDTPVTGYGPSQPPPEPTLAPSYVLITSTLAVYLDFNDGLVAVTGLEQLSGPPPSLCVYTHSEEDMTYVQSGTTVDVKALYISSTPFTINPDGTIQHEVSQPNGTVATDVYVPGTNDAYNAAVQQMTAKYAYC